MSEKMFDMLLARH